MYKRNLLGEIRIMKDLNIIPNFSALQREYGVDRHTIKKYYDNDGIPKRKSKNSQSKWDPYFEELQELLNLPHVSYKSIWMYLYHKYGDELPGDYDSLRNYFYRLGMRITLHNTPHVLYETDPGKQAQFDWKENLSLHLKDGTLIEFNVFSLTLSYSREHIFIYSKHKGTEDFLYCFIKAINRVGGTCEEYLTDNMSAIVSVNGNNRKINSKVNALFKDINSKLRLCKVNTPETKGKDENANKFVNWIYPYDYKLETEEEIIRLIEDTITSDANRQINTGTMMPPATLFTKEKEYLKPLPSKILLDSYLSNHTKQTVPPTQLVYYKGNKYSVGSDYVSKTVDIYEISNELYIYYQSKLIAKHTISQNKINYTKEHYQEGLSLSLTNKTADEIEEMASKSLEKLKVLGDVK